MLFVLDAGSRFSAVDVGMRLDVESDCTNGDSFLSEFVRLHFDGGGDERAARDGGDLPR